MTQPFAALLIVVWRWKIVIRPVFFALGVASALSLGACSGGAAPANESASAEPGSPDDMEVRLESLSQGQRDAVFLRAIRDGDGDCQHVESSERAGEHDGLPIWRARCERSKSYTIVISAAGTAQILDDSQVRLSHEAPPKEKGRGQ